MFEAVLDYKERQNSEKEKRKHQNGKGDSDVGVDTDRAEKLAWPLEEAEDLATFQFRPVIAKDGEIAGVKSMFQEGHVEQPVPAEGRVFHQHEEAGKRCEERDAPRRDDKRQLNVRQRTGEKAEPL